ncbi:MAG: hypothetical protein LBH73_06650, partial [Spirochaetaceae bacterium]|nr:hypothetical protein [Spirochaetaceae bacterium]
MGDLAQRRGPSKGLSVEDVWAMLQETDRILKENALQQKETDRKMAETDRIVKENARRQKETDKQIGELGNRFGELAEHLVTPNIAAKFRALGYAFTKAGPNLEFFDEKGKSLAEVDVWLENGEFALAVEVKS